MATGTKTKPTAYVCEVCGRDFATRQALGGHMSGHDRKAEEPDPEPERGAYEAKVWTTLREMADPLRSQLGEIDARLDAVERERSDLRKARVEIVGVLSKLDPSTAKPKAKKVGVALGNAARATRQQQAKTEALADYFEEHPDEFADGFTANILAERLTSRIPRGLSNSSARKALEELRDRGIVRADKVVKGGGMQWKLNASTNGDGNG